VLAPSLNCQNLPLAAKQTLWENAPTLNKLDHDIKKINVDIDKIKIDPKIKA
jgi:hypothetical protein